MALKAIDELTKLAFSTFLSFIETQVMPVKKQGDSAGAYGIYVAQMLIVPYDASVAYLAGRHLVFEGQHFIVVTATTAGDTPHTARAKFQYLGGGVNEANTATGDPATGAVTLNKTSGVLNFNFGSNAIAAGGTKIITLTNTTLGAISTQDIDITLSYSDTGGGGGALIKAYQKASTNTIEIFLFNVSTGGSDADGTAQILFNIAV